MGGRLIAIAVGVSALAASAQAADPALHRAIYEMSLTRTSAASGIASARGTMTYEFSDSCDGWTVQNKTILVLAYAEGGQINSTWDFATWESKDGLSYRFRVRSTQDGVVTEEVDGKASLRGRGQGGEAVFNKPEPKTVELPPGTMFPTEHSQYLLDAADKGQRYVARMVFDGAGDSNPLLVGAAIGREQAGEGERELLRTAFWPMRLAFFPEELEAELPDYEVELNYHANGVSSDVLQDYGDFSLRGEIEALESLPEPSC